MWCDHFCHRNTKTWAGMVRMLLSRDAQVQRSAESSGSSGEQSAWVVGATVSIVPAYAQTPLCERAYVAECAGWGYAQYKMDPSGQACSGPVPVDGERKGER